MRYLVIALMLLSPNIFSKDFRTGLIVTIDQKTLGGFDQVASSIGVTGMKKLLEPAKALGSFGEAIGGLIEQLDSHGLISAWDKARRQLIEKQAAGKYTNIYFVLGDLTRDDAYMAFTWKSALENNDVVDYVSMVHGGDQTIKPEWNVPKDSKKLRMVYSEACQGGSGKDHFVVEHGALFAAGHNASTTHPSASPFFSFAFLKAWFGGANFRNALATAWAEGSTLLSTRGFELAQQMAGYRSKEDALAGSRIVLSWDISVDPKEVTIDFDSRGITRSKIANEDQIDQT